MFKTIKASQHITIDFPDLKCAPGFRSIAGLLFIPLSPDCPDFVIFFRKDQLKEVHWAANPYTKQTQTEGFQPLEPRRSFKKWIERVRETSQDWTEDQCEHLYPRSLQFADS
jgi:light-regulated signal transduction histidine kinase (bacteriophytochrome)